MSADVSVIDWAAQPLGKVSDGEIAKALGMGATTVRKHRTKLGIPAFQGTTNNTTLVKPAAPVVVHRQVQAKKKPEGKMLTFQKPLQEYKTALLDLFAAEDGAKHTQVVNSMARLLKRTQSVLAMTQAHPDLREDIRSFLAWMDDLLNPGKAEEARNQSVKKAIEADKLHVATLPY